MPREKLRSGGRRVGCLKVRVGGGRWVRYNCGGTHTGRPQRSHSVVRLGTPRRSRDVATRAATGVRAA